jgi:exonuclease VII large subunit
MNQFKERSIAMNTAPMTEDEIDSIVEQLPEDVRVAITSEVNAYKKASEGWSDTTQWSGNTAAYAQAKQAETALRQKAARLSERALFLDIDEKRRIDRQNRADIQNAELRMLDRPSDLDIERRAKMITKNKDGEPNLADRAEALSQLTQENIEDQLEIINRLNPERAKELGYETIDISEAEKVLTEDPTEENKQLFIRLYGSEAFAKWQSKNETISEAPTEQGVLDIAVGVPARAVGSAIQRNIGEPISEAITLGLEILAEILVLYL